MGNLLAIRENGKTSLIFLPFFPLWYRESPTTSYDWHRSHYIKKHVNRRYNTHIGYTLPELCLNQSLPTNLIPIVCPAPKLEVTHLLIKGEVAHVNKAWALVDGRWDPLDCAVAEHSDELMVLLSLVLLISARTNSEHDGRLTSMSAISVCVCLCERGLLIL